MNDFQFRDLVYHHWRKQQWRRFFPWPARLDKLREERMNPEQLQEGQQSHKENEHD